MPQFLELKRQKGSILAGVLALSMAMTAIAGGYVLIAGNTASGRLDAMDDLRLHYAAEGGAQLGIRWLKGYNAKYYSRQNGNPPLWGEPVLISPAGFSIDGIGVEVKAVPTPEGPGIFQINSRATSADQKTTLVITWAINSAGPGQNGLQSSLFTDYWIETYPPGNP